MAKLNYEELNNTVRYSMHSVFRAEQGKLPEDRAQVAAEAQQYLESLEQKHVTVRGVYDVSGLRADADYMVWWHAERIEDLQAAYAGLRRTALGRASVPVWSQASLHRPAEFNKSHIPAFIAGEEPRAFICVYPFVRSHDWYLLPDEERRRMLVEHGQKAREYPDVRANTVPAFGLGNYEWILSFEADEMHRIVELMWLMRYTDARKHVHVETPFYSGARLPISDIVTNLA